MTKFVTSCHRDFNTAYGPQNTVWRETEDLSPRECSAAWEKGRLAYGIHDIDFVPDAPTSFKFFSHGSADGEGYVQCSGFYSGDKYFQYAYEQTLLEITIGKIPGTADYPSGTVSFEGVVEKLDRGHLSDGTLGTVVWHVEPTDCRLTSSQVYVGPAEVYRTRNSQEVDDVAGAVVILRSPSTGQFAGFHLREDHRHCGRMCKAGHIPGITVCFLEDGESPEGYTFHPEAADLAHPQLLAQLGFLYLDSGKKAQERLELVMDHMCEIETREYRGRLQELAGTGSPYAMLDHYGRGFTVEVSGAVAYILKCPARNVSRAFFHNCTQEIPVSADGQVRFADPLTMILKDFPTIIPCSPVMPPRYNILGEWYCGYPDLRVCEAPKKLDPNGPSLKEYDFAEGMGHGIFTTEQLERHRDYWRAATSRKAVLSQASSAATSRSQRPGELGLSIPYENMSELGGIISGYLFPILPSLGYLWATVSGVFLLFSIGKTVIECMVRMFYLYWERGCGPWVLLGLWNLLWQIGHTPGRLVKSALQRLREDFDPLRMPGVRPDQTLGGGQEEPEDPTSAVTAAGAATAIPAPTESYQARKRAWGYSVPLSQLRKWGQDARGTSSPAPPQSDAGLVNIAFDGPNGGEDIEDPKGGPEPPNGGAPV